LVSIHSDPSSSKGCLSRLPLEANRSNGSTTRRWKYFHKQEICLPTSSSVEVLVKGVGETKPSWRALLGLKGEYESEVRFEKLQISVQTDGFDDIKSKIDGEYLALPKCGGACVRLSFQPTSIALLMVRAETLF
jgi:hypothetical protein